MKESKWLHRFTVCVYPDGGRSLTIRSKDSGTLQRVLDQYLCTPPDEAREGVYYPEGDSGWTLERPLYAGPERPTTGRRHALRAWLLEEIGKRPGGIFRDDLEGRFFELRGGKRDTAERGMARHLRVLKNLGLVDSIIEADGRARYHLVSPSR